jgi:hypothetical protein
MGTQKESAEKQLAAPAADDRLSVYHRFTAAGADAVLGQMLADRLNAGNKTIAFQQSLFLNAFALIEFFKALLRLLFCPHVPALRPSPFGTSANTGRCA